MLVLTRKTNEVIHIGDNIVVRVVRTSGSAVKIGIEAPKDIEILRGELHKAKPAPEKATTVASQHRIARTAS